MPLLMCTGLALAGMGFAVAGRGIAGDTAVSVAGAAAGPYARDFTDIAAVPLTPVPAPGPDASTGTVTEDCGRNDEGHYNADNLVISPGYRNGAHHIHEYVGNLSTDAFSTDASLAAAATTCADGDRSTYYWPVLRRQDQPETNGPHVHGDGGARHGNIGQIVRPASVRIEFGGSAVSHVVAMPRFLRMITGDPVAGTQGDANAHAQWGCSTSPGHYTALYPRCPAGGLTTRTLDFPSCWNGLATDSADHRSHVAFPAANGACPARTFPVPRLRIVLSYELPPGVPFAVDAFSEQHHSPKTDHALFVDLMTDARMASVVRCLNSGRHCR
ncbi:DUF1996 domain-containing protein [Streptomyces sp. NPDC059373]